MLRNKIIEYTDKFIEYYARIHDVLAKYLPKTAEYDIATTNTYHILVNVSMYNELNKLKDEIGAMEKSIENYIVSLFSSENPLSTSIGNEIERYLKLIVRPDYTVEIKYTLGKQHVIIDRENKKVIVYLPNLMTQSFILTDFALLNDLSGEELVLNIVGLVLGPYEDVVRPEVAKYDYVGDFLKDVYRGRIPVSDNMTLLSYLIYVWRHYTLLHDALIEMLKRDIIEVGTPLHYVQYVVVELEENFYNIWTFFYILFKLGVKTCRTY